MHEGGRADEGRPILHRSQSDRTGYGVYNNGSMRYHRCFGRGGRVIPREASFRIPMPFHLPSESFVSVDDKNVETEYKYVHPNKSRNLFSKLFKDRKIQPIPEEDPGEIAGDIEKSQPVESIASLYWKHMFTAVLVIVAVFADGLRPITLVWAKDGHSKYPFSFNVWLVIVKFSVIFFSVIMYFLAPVEERVSSASKSTRLKLSLFLVPPTLLYVFSDLINFYAFQYISASTFAVLKQSRLAMVALLFRFFLHRYISQIQWIAVAQLLLAAMLFEAKTIDAGGEGENSGSNELLGMLLVLLKCCLDSLAVIWMDKYFKKLSGSGFSYPEQQIVYAVYGFLIGIIVAIIQDDGTLFTQPIFTGWTTGAYVSASLAALYGVLVSLVLRYLDSMIKMFQSLLSVVVTVMLDRYFFGEQVDVVKAIAISFVLISVFLYKLGTVKKKEE
mmetsp:Transcript_413/g.738  ORF Transcript_413/g.738 Transcript_413/m.738 type:complete len:444 (+) Transcript_413:103-1434(+)